MLLGEAEEGKVNGVIAIALCACTANGSKRANCSNYICEEENSDALASEMDALIEK